MSDVPSADSTATTASPAPASVTLTLLLRGTRTVVEYRPGDTVLETARRAGLKPPFSCEMGNCATCMAKVSNGSVSMRVNDALGDDEVAEGWVLTCQSLPTSVELTVNWEAV